MATKAENTTQFILEKVAPVFNKNGYVGTSLSDITKATGLTKGAIYGNFESKESLAIEAFNYNIRKVVGLKAEKINKQRSATAKLQAVTNFYREYYEETVEFGGCPILNVGIDSNNLNPRLKVRVNNVIGKLKMGLADIVDLGKLQQEFKLDVDADAFGLKIFSIIEGSLFTALMLKDRKHLFDMMDHIDNMITTELKV